MRYRPDANVTILFSGVRMKAMWTVFYAAMDGSYIDAHGWCGDLPVCPVRLADYLLNG